MNQLPRAYIVLLAMAKFCTGFGDTECVSHATLKCINDASTFWPRCDPSQTKTDNFPTLHGRTPEDYGHFCTQQWADALNAMLSKSVVNKCGDRDAQIKLLAEVAVETGFFTTLFQPADGGAGLVHMIPNNWPINAQDMEELFEDNFVQRQAAQGADFFQTPNDGWLSVAAWYKLTNRVIPGCGKDLFDEPFDVQTQCIFGRPNDRSEAFNIVSRCFGATPSTTRRSGGGCSGSPCSDVSLCRSKFGHCGSSADHCNSESTWKAEGCGGFSATTTTSTVTTGTTMMESTSTATTSTTSSHGSTCSGSPCPDVTLCRSKWGFCGSSVDHCNAESTWTVAGCGAVSTTAASSSIPSTTVRQTSTTTTTTIVTTTTATSSVPSTTVVQTSATITTITMTTSTSSIPSTTAVQTSATSTTTVSDSESVCIGAPCPDLTMCRSKWGFCGSSAQYCNTESIWKASGCKTNGGGDDGCFGEPCSSSGLCRSKWGHCGASPQHCNQESTWKAAGCTQINFAVLSLNGTIMSTNSTANSGSISLSRASRSLTGNFIMVVSALFWPALAK